jgi:hypothetical protein
MVSVDDYIEVKDCIYRGEHYSVRDNGAVMRHQREGKSKRKLDDIWTFGTPIADKAYLAIGSERVHRIVATAFHGAAPTPEHIVDHIDTNRKNNRPENLRWLTRLENALLNPITRKKIELIYGSVEAFLANPQLLWGHETEDKNFAWMKTVTKEEAQNCLANWDNWAKTVKPDPNYKTSEHQIGDWMFDNPFMNKVPDGNGGYNEIRQSAPEIDDQQIKQLDKHPLAEKEPMITQSLTPNAVQIDWKYPVEFPCCPQEFLGDPLEAYMANLAEGKVFSTNNYGKSIIIKFGMPQSDRLWVMSSISIGFKSHAFTKITFNDGLFYHENMGAYDIGDDPESIFEEILNGNVK